MTSTIVHSEKELATAIQNQADSIEIYGDFAKKVVRIKVVGKLSWVVCGASLAAAIALFIATPTATVATAPAGGSGGVVSFGSGVAMSTVAAVSLGTATTTAIAIGVAAGGIAVINSLRDKYKIVEKNDNYLKLQRKA